MNDTHENQQPLTPRSVAAPEKMVCGAGHFPGHVLFILLQYMVSCVTLSFWMHPCALSPFSSSLGFTPNFSRHRQAVGKSWPRLVLGVVCVECSDRFPNWPCGLLPRGGDPGEAALGLSNRRNRPFVHGLRRYQAVGSAAPPIASFEKT